MCGSMLLLPSLVTALPWFAGSERPLGDSERLTIPPTTGHRYPQRHLPLSFPFPEGFPVGIFFVTSTCSCIAFGQKILKTLFFGRSMPPPMVVALIDVTQVYTDCRSSGTEDGGSGGGNGNGGGKPSMVGVVDVGLGGVGGVGGGDGGESAVVVAGCGGSEAPESVGAAGASAAASGALGGASSSLLARETCGAGAGNALFDTR